MDDAALWGYGILFGAVLGAVIQLFLQPLFERTLWRLVRGGSSKKFFYKS